MKKAKTNKNLITILSAIIGVVFAFITGVTYCATSLNLQYGTSPTSISAHLGNQQYHIVNDTLTNPILYGEGSHNFEIALQYAFDYNFDVRFKYEMKWSDNTTATNVILHFANRDNIIYDEQYIFLANGIEAGNGKVTIITGVDFVNTQDSNYYNKSLKINITEVKVYKTQTTYANTHVLYKDVTTSVAAQAWLNNKNKASTATTYVMMYNYRRNYANGVPYPGLDTAYKKPLNTTSNTVSGAAWLGGNKAYAGTGMYIITGTSTVKFEVEVAGIWRNSSNANIEDASLISENSIKYNYTKDWTHSSWNANRLWETKKFNYVIPAKTACYIEILDNVEVTSAGRVVTNLYDSYRAVTNSITINPTLASATEFEYTESSAEFIQMKTMSNNTAISGVTTNYSQADVDIVNSSLYSNGLYLANVGGGSAQSFNTNISLINNTNVAKTVSVNYKLYYYISNGQTNLTNEIDNGDSTKSYLRAEEYIGTKYTETTTDPETGDETSVEKTYTEQDVFAKLNLYYGYAIESNRLSGTLTTSVTIAPYSSVNLVESYGVANTLQSDVTTKFDTNSTDNKNDYYDVWTYLVVTPTATNATGTTSNLAVESAVSGNTVSLIVKNNTNNTISDLSVSSISVKELSNETYTALTAQPADWTANYWKYYTRSGSEGSYVYTQLTSDPITANNPFVGNKYYAKSQTYTELTVTAASGFTKSGTTITKSSGLSLKPGESVVIGTATKAATGKIIVSASAKTTTAAAASGILLINSGKQDAYIVNHTSNSYFVRFGGNYTGSNANIEKAGSYYYYIGIVRPGQIISVPMATGTPSTVTASATYSASTLTSAGWDSAIVTKLTNLLT